MAEIDTIIWDVGGVLIRDAPIAERVRQRLDMDRSAFDPLWTEQVAQYGIGSISETAFWSAFEAEGGKPVEPEEDVLGRVLEEDLVVYHGVLAYTHQLAEIGYERQAILSNTIPNHAKVLQTAGVYDAFASPIDTYLSHEIGFRKPDKRAFGSVLIALGARPERTVFVDDQPAYLRSAAEMGMTPVHAAGDEAQIIDAIAKVLRSPSLR